MSFASFFSSAGGASSVASGGNLLNTALSYELNKKAATTAFDRTNYMMSTSHQREVEDLKKAGLNPILSATGGSGAGGSAQMAAPAHTSNAVMDALSAMKVKAEIDNIKANTAKAAAETDVKAPKALVGRLVNSAAGAVKKFFPPLFNRSPKPESKPLNNAGWSKFYKSDLNLVPQKRAPYWSK